MARRSAGVWVVMALAALAIATRPTPSEVANQRIAGGLGRPQSDDAPPRTGMEARTPNVKEAAPSSTSTTLPDAPGRGDAGAHHQPR